MKNKQTNCYSSKPGFVFFKVLKARAGPGRRQRDRQRDEDRQTDRQTERHRDKGSDRDRMRQTDRHRKKERERDKDPFAKHLQSFQRVEQAPLQAV